MVQHTKICKFNTLSKEAEKQNPHDHLIRFREGLSQYLTLLLCKSSGEFRATRNAPKHHKGNLERAHNQYQHTWIETKSIQLK